MIKDKIDDPSLTPYLDVIENRHLFIEVLSLFIYILIELYE